MPTASPLALPPQIEDLISRGALFAVNHSGGKDSQAMYLYLRQFVPADQIVHIHANLGVVEWAGAVEHIKATTAGEPLRVCSARRTLLEMIEERGMFPSPTRRQCTSDLKRGPIERTIRKITRERQALGLEAWGLVVNCMGMRAQESPKRAKLKPFQYSVRNSKANREWYDWLPIHDWTEKQVFEAIAQAGQQPHVVYSLGMRRFSCVFCILASEADLKTAARLATERPELLNDPHLYRKYVHLERSTGQVMLMPDKKRGRRTLEDITGVYIDPARTITKASFTPDMQTSAA
ncbi:phosphoadenosine phosphosulfate reductase family protein [Pelomonas sp. APW6]|uniref:Phosphoadenosine phosphosulfate reductase family protein n=2 Tax=Roseateles subflavus TaxID=3053353 RepID=A0ABT7LNE6_9BURK|nr:phosphoadenosine phosphosulfate reductase family protein [Pelomonas sp. APW6]